MVRGKNARWENARWGHCSSDHGRAQHDGDGSKPQETGARWERTEGDTLSLTSGRTCEGERTDGDTLSLTSGRTCEATIGSALSPRAPVKGDRGVVHRN